MDRIELISKLCVVTTKIFKSIENKIDLYQFGFITDQDSSTISIAYNTFSHFANTLKNVFLEDHFVPNNYRWHMAEWFAEIGQLDHELTTINSLISKYRIQVLQSGKKWDKSLILDVLFVTLHKMRENGVFEGLNEDFILYIERSDSIINSTMINKLEKLFDNDEVFEEFNVEMQEYLV